jgi:uncharacterized membrane protein
MSIVEFLWPVFALGICAGLFFALVAFVGSAALLAFGAIGNIAHALIRLCVAIWRATGVKHD